jgi:hypothetical protein
MRGNSHAKVRRTRLQGYFKYAMKSRFPFRIISKMSSNIKTRYLKRVYFALIPFITFSSSTSFHLFTASFWFHLFWFSILNPQFRPEFSTMTWIRIVIQLCLPQICTLIQLFVMEYTVEVEVTLRMTVSRSVSQSVSQSVSMSWCRSPLWGPRPDFTFPFPL